MHLPNYKDGSIVNLMSSIARAFSAKTQYRPLKLLPPKSLKTRNIVLILFDGLGYEYIRREGKGTVFQKYLKGTITSVFPATTSSAITSFTTGKAPQQHAVIGWFMHLKEKGVVCITLPFLTRAGKTPLSALGIRMEEIYDIESLMQKLNAKTYVIKPQEIINSEYTKMCCKGSKRIGYSGVKEFFKKITSTMKTSNQRKKSSDQRKYIFAYSPEFDTLCHKKGVKNRETKKLFQEFDTELRTLIKKLKNTDTTIIITADHGLIDATKKQTILLKNHPRLKECLSMPVCGDKRTAYCYVHPKKAKEFETYAQKKLKKYCHVFKSEYLMRRGYFGQGKPNPKLCERIGDYTLIMKKNFAFKDMISDSEKTINIGNHGGTSKEEMLVPLIIIEP